MSKKRKAMLIVLLLFWLAWLTAGIVALTFFVARGKATGKDTWIPKEYQVMCEQVGKKYQVCPELLEAQIEAESSGKPNAVNGSCCGLLQINKNVHQDRMKRLGVTNVFDPYSNILIGASIMREIFDEYADTDLNGTLEIILMRYNGVSQAEAKARRGEYNTYAIKIINRSMELERLHNK